MIDKILSEYPQKMKSLALPADVVHEATRRILDAVGCFYGAFNERPVRILRETLTKRQSGACSIWGTRMTATPELAAMINGAAVRALDYNDTYLSKEPCHPSDLLAPLWALSEYVGGSRQGERLANALVLSYEVLCRLCDATSLRLRGWDHVTYLPIASAVGSSYLLGLDRKETAHAIALAVVGNNALRQTRVGVISDWKAACAAYAARSGLWAARLAHSGFTGPSDIFTGRHGFFAQVSGPFSISTAPLGKTWKIMKTHTKFYPAEHHAQSAIEAALLVRRYIGKRRIQKVTIESFKAAVEIIGSEKEKWLPTTRETADHSLPFLVVAALLDGDLSLEQFRRKRYLDRDVRALLGKVAVTESKKYTKIYPAFLPNCVVVQLTDGDVISREILLPKGYAGRAMTDDEIKSKFLRLSAKEVPAKKQNSLIKTIGRLETVQKLPKI